MDKQYCAHPCLFKGLCVDCGQSLVSVEKSKEYINLEWLSGSSGLIASKDYATKIMFQKDQQNPLEKKKLNLVLDLDETLIHTYKKKFQPYHYQLFPEGFMSEEDGENENSMDIDEEFPPIIDEYKETSFVIGSYIYSVVFRPGVEEFLNEISMYYDIFVYTHGTNIYSENIMKLLKKRLENKKIQFTIQGLLSRQSQKIKTQKNLKKMMCNNKLTLIIDDSPHVWCDEDQESILTVSPFKGSNQDKELYYLSDYLKSIHNNFYNSNSKDVRKILRNMMA